MVSVQQPDSLDSPLFVHCKDFAWNILKSADIQSISILVQKINLLQNTDYIHTSYLMVASGSFRFFPPPDAWDSFRICSTCKNSNIKQMSFVKFAMVNLHKPQNLTGVLPPLALCNTIKINFHCTELAKLILLHFHCAPSEWKIAEPEKMQIFCSDRWKCL